MARRGAAEQLTLASRTRYPADVECWSVEKGIDTENRSDGSGALAGRDVNHCPDRDACRELSYRGTELLGQRSVLQRSMQRFRLRLAGL